MSSQLKATIMDNATAKRLTLEMQQRLQEAAGLDLKDKLATGEITLVNGRYVSSDNNLKVKRASVFSPRLKKVQRKAS